MKLAYLETDASLDSRRELVGLDGRLYMAGAGVVLRDIQHRPFVVKPIPLGYQADPLRAETLALIHGLEEAAAHGIRGVWAMTDSLPLVQALDGQQFNRDLDQLAVEGRLTALRENFVFARVRWSKGSHRKWKFGGPSADALARAAIGLGRRH